MSISLGNEVKRLLNDSSKIYSFDEYRLNNNLKDYSKDVSIIYSLNEDYIVSDLGLFNEIYNNIVLCLKGFDLIDNGLILAGGSVVQIVKTTKYGRTRINDLDLFPIGHTVDSINRTIFNLTAHLNEYCKKNNATDLVIFQTRNAITFSSCMAQFSVQIISGQDYKYVKQIEKKQLLKPMLELKKISNELFNLSSNIDYQNIKNMCNDFQLAIEEELVNIPKPNRIELIKQILDGFDITCCQIAWDGIQLYMTDLGKFSLENNSIIFNNITYSSSTNNRIIKYFDRGFNLILPFCNSQYDLLPFLSVNIDYKNNISIIKLKNSIINKSIINNSNYESIDSKFLISENYIYLNNFIYRNLLNYKYIHILSKNEFDNIFIKKFIINFIEIEINKKQTNILQLKNILNTELTIQLITNKLNNKPLITQNIDEYLTTEISTFINKFKPINYQIIHQELDINQIFEKKGISLKEWYGETFIN